MVLCSAALWGQASSITGGLLKKVPATLKMKDGSEMSGEIFFRKPYIKEITLYYGENGKKNIPCNDIDRIFLTIYDGTVLECERQMIYTNKSVRKRKFDKTTKDPAWLIIIEHGYVTFYYLYFDNRKWISENRYIENRNVIEVGLWSYCMKQGDYAATFVGWANCGAFGMQKLLQNGASKVFAEDKEIIEKINSGEYRCEVLREIVWEFNKRNTPR
jgi:hypothetical protein